MPATDQKQGAKELVERSRAGDQNAMAILQLIGENARAGDPKAQAGLSAVQKYIADHPPPLVEWPEAAQTIGVLKHPDNTDDVLFDALLTLPEFEDPRIVHTACVVLAQGPEWTRRRIHGIDQLMEPGCDEQKQYRFGVEHAADPKFIRPQMSRLPRELAGFLCAGHCIGTARKLQLIQRADISPGILCKDVEWELGCC
jgi:hypothetical protein